MSTQVLQNAPAAPQAAVAPGAAHLLQRKAAGTGQLSGVPPIVHDVLASPGQPLDAETRAFMEPRFGHDFSRVRVHAGGRAAESARAINARAYAFGRDVVFARENKPQGSREDAWVLAHELAHVVQQSRGGATPPLGPDSGLEQSAERASIQAVQGKGLISVSGASGLGLARLADTADVPIILAQDLDVGKMTPDLRKRYIDVIDARLGYLDIQAKKTPQSDLGIKIPGLEASNPDAERARLFDWRGKLEQGAGTLVVPDIQRSTPAPVLSSSSGKPAPDVGKNAIPQIKSVNELSNLEKLSKAKDYAGDYLDEDVKKEVNNLFSPQALAMMALFAAVYIAAQVTPAGWVADALALTVITVSVVFVGMQLFDIFSHIGGYIAAINAKTDGDLRTAGHELSLAIAKGGVALVIALLTHSAKGAIKGATPYDPPPTGMVDAVTDTGIVIRVPAQAAPTVVPASIPVSLTAKAVMVPPPTTSSGSGGRSGGGSVPEPPTTKGPEVFDEISKELGLEKDANNNLSGTKAEVAQGSVEKSEAAGFTKGGGPGTVDLATQPHSDAPAVREAQGVTGGTHQSAHIGPTSALKDVTGYSRGGAETTILPKEVHAAFDQTWKDWAINQRKAGRTQVTVSELYNVMLDAIDRTPNLLQRTKNALAWRLQLELYRDLGLKPDDTVGIPYPNVKPQP